MEDGDPDTRICPNRCTRGEITALALAQRQMLLCCCLQCHALWLESVDGAQQFPDTELRALERLRARYLSGELTS